MYLKKLPNWMQLFYPKRLFRYKTTEKVLYLTFDDGPNPDTTTFILDILAKYQAKATFFCIGKNVSQYPHLYQSMIAQGHLIGNHTQHHLNGWKVKKDIYLQDILQADKLLNAPFFRPPYGRMRRKEEGTLYQKQPSMRVVMWTILSGDFDKKISGLQCWENVHKNVFPGAIIVFHDSDKAKERMEYALPKVLEYYTEQGFRFEVLH